LLSVCNSSGESNKHRVKLIVLDSIAAVFRPNFENTKGSLAARSRWLGRIGGLLHVLEHRYACSFVVINQVSSGPRNLMRASLGLVWSNLVNTRIALTFNEAPGQDEDNPASSDSKTQKRGPKVLPLRKRNLHVDFSPVHPEISVGYKIYAYGLCAG